MNPLKIKDTASLPRQLVSSHINCRVRSAAGLIKPVAMPSRPRGPSLAKHSPSKRIRRVGNCHHSALETQRGALDREPVRTQTRVELGKRQRPSTVHLAKRREMRRLFGAVVNGTDIDPVLNKVVSTAVTAQARSRRGLAAAIARHRAILLSTSAMWSNMVRIGPTRFGVSAPGATRVFHNEPASSASVLNQCYQRATIKLLLRRNK